MTVLEVIRRSAEFLGKKGVDSPRLQSELLLAEVLKVPRMKLYLDFERTLTTAELDTCREFVRRRGQREPLQQIVGSTSFCGLEIAVSRQVLVPRPETELLAEKAWDFLRKRTEDRGQGGANTKHQTPNTKETPNSKLQTSSLEDSGQNAKNRVASPLAPRPSPLTPPPPPLAAALDFGTGSGCLAIALAVKSPGVRILATDRSAEALELARQNGTRHGTGNRIEFLLSEGFAAVPTEARFDLIVSNPPYIPSADIGALQPEVRDFEPRAALDGGADGLDFYRLLAAEAGRFLNSEGRLMVEFGDGQAEALRRLFEQQNWIVESVESDYNQRPRVLVVRRNQ